MSYEVYERIDANKPPKLIADFEKKKDAEQYVELTKKHSGRELLVATWWKAGDGK